MRLTIRVIGKAIIDGSRYLPIRNRAAALASKAQGHKEYAQQVKEIFDDFVKRWRYVKDPVGRELVTTSPAQVFHLVMGGTSTDPGAGFGRGVGDCDDATVAIGAQLMAIGIPVRIATIAPQGAPAGNMMSHVFCQGNVPGLGWVTVDPVVYPHHGCFYTPPNSRLAVFGLDGQFLGGSGNIRNMSGASDFAGIRENTMNFNVNDFDDLSGYDDYSTGEPVDFRRYGVKNFGAYAESMGILDLGNSSLGLAAEVETDAQGRQWTPMLELRPHDYNYIKQTGRPFHGMLALGVTDELTPYQYDENLGFFKKIFKKVRKKARKLAKKVLSKIPGGKYLLKLGKKIWKISRKLVAPLTKFVGKYAKKLAPIAAFIPGFGPAVAAGLYTAGKVANIMQKFGVKVVSKKGDKVAKLKFPKGKAAKGFKKALKKAAKSEAKRQKSRGRRRPSRRMQKRAMSRRRPMGRRMRA